MKAKILKCPFKWEQRKVLIQDRIWYVPEYYDRYETFLFPGWEHLFGNCNPIRVEFCSGNGSWITEKAKQSSEFNWVAVEKQFQRVRKIWAKMKKEELQNLVSICGEAYTATRLYFPSESISDFFINFPDPWPKRRHGKHRLIHSSLINELCRCLTDGGTVTLVTDDDTYSKAMIDAIGAHQGFRSNFGDPYFVTHLQGYGSSFFETLWRSRGKAIRYHQFRKVG